MATLVFAFPHLHQCISPVASVVMLGLAVSLVLLLQQRSSNTKMTEKLVGDGETESENRTTKRRSLAETPSSSTSSMQDVTVTFNQDEGSGIDTAAEAAQQVVDRYREISTDGVEEKRVGPPNPSAPVKTNHEKKREGPNPSTLVNTNHLTADSEDAKNDDDGNDADVVDATKKMRKAVTAGNVKELQSAINDGADVNNADEQGETALHFAADQGSVECVEILLNAGADPNAADKHGISCLQAAVIGGDVETVRLLLKAGADPEHEDDDGDTPRSCADDDGGEEMQKLFRGGDDL